jgi:hypothetical protein
VGDIVERPYKCDVTGNPVGTDTVRIGFVCGCQGCRAHREIQRLRAEVERLRKIISDCADATGAFVAPTCSLVFMEDLPNEIRLSRAGLRAEAFERAAQIADVQSVLFEKQAAHTEDALVHDALVMASDACELVACEIRQASKKGGEG